MEKYLKPSPNNIEQLQKSKIDGAVTMLNLLKFRDIANYSGLEKLSPNKEISGAEAYQLYGKFTFPILHKYGAEVLFKGKGNHFLIGPSTESWDMVLLVRHESLVKFMAFAQDAEYLQTAGHRTAALENSRLLPIQDL